MTPAIRNFGDYVITGHVDDDQGSGLHVGSKPGSLLLRTYKADGTSESVEIDDKLFNGVAHFILQELLHRHRKCLENQLSQIKS